MSYKSNYLLTVEYDWQEMKVTEIEFARAHAETVFENCSFERMQITGEYFDKHTDERAACDAIELVGFDEPGYELKDILFRDVTIGKEGHTGKQTLTLQLCENITFERLRA